MPDEALNVTLLLTVPLAGGVIGLGLGVQVTPAGRLAQLNVTALVKLLIEVTVQVVAADPPGETVTDVGLHEKAKSGGGGGGTKDGLNTVVPAASVTAQRTLASLPEKVHWLAGLELNGPVSAQTCGFGRGARMGHGTGTSRPCRAAMQQMSGSPVAVSAHGSGGGQVLGVTYQT